MIRAMHLFAAAALAVGPASLPAQLSKGGTPPPLVIDKAWNGAPMNWDEFAGKVVILDFAQTW
jgi:hypothetical protein